MVVSPVPLLQLPGSLSLNRFSDTCTDLRHKNTLNIQKNTLCGTRVSVITEILRKTASHAKIHWNRTIGCWVIAKINMAAVRHRQAPSWVLNIVYFWSCDCCWVFYSIVYTGHFKHHLLGIQSIWKHEIWFVWHRKQFLQICLQICLQIWTWFKKGSRDTLFVALSLLQCIWLPIRGIPSGYYHNVWCGKIKTVWISDVRKVWWYVSK